MSPRTIADAKQMWVRLATEAAPLGKLAVQERLDKWGGQTGVEIISVAVAGKLNPGSFEVGVNFRNPHLLGGTNDTHHFFVDNPNLESTDYKVTERFITDRQSHMAPHLAGLPNNVDEFMYNKIVELVSRVTQYTVAKGDLWVHACDTLTAAENNGLHEGMIAFGAVTLAGQIALDKYMDITGLRLPEPTVVEAKS
jgi:hypothetical protein